MFMPTDTPDKAERVSQTLLRALDILDAARGGPVALTELERRLGLTRSTAHRLASALVDRRLLTHDARKGYRLGPKLMDLGFQARESTSLAAVAQPVLDGLSQTMEDASNLGVPDGDHVVYIARSPSRRRVAVRHQVGDRNRISTTALGRALMLDASTESWTAYFPDEPQPAAKAIGAAWHFDEAGDCIRCVAAPIRDASGAIVAAVSLSSIPQYMPEDRMALAEREVVDAANAISRRLGWGWET
jgi:DNA-binding IclR family transcriptional regulator